MSHMNWKPLPENHRRRLDAQTRLLEMRRPEFLSPLGNLREYAHRLEVIEEDGNLIAVRSNSQQGIRTMLPQEQGSILIQRQRTALHAPFERGARFLVLSGIGVGHSLLMAQAMLEKHPTAGVAAWDWDPCAWTAFFALFDAKKAIENTDRIFFFGGESIHEQVDEFLRRRKLFLFPSDKTAYLLGSLPVHPAATEKYIEQARSLAKMIQEENARFEPAIQSCLKRSASDDRAPRSAWSCARPDAYIHYPIAKAFLEGLERAGLSTHLEPFDDQFGRSFETLGDFFERKPELLLMLNVWPTAFLYDMGLSIEAIESMQLWRVCWMVDDTLLYADEGPMAQTGGRDFVFCCDRTYLPRMQAYSCQSFFLPHAAIFTGPGRVRDEFKADLCYVGSLPDVQGLLEDMPPACREMLERVEKLRSERWDCTFSQHLASLEPTPAQRQCIAQTAHDFCQSAYKDYTDVNVELNYFLYNAATYFKRYKTVMRLLPLGLKVYGPASWREALPTKYRDRYGGFINNEDLADCYASSKICINIHSHQCPTCLNPRDFDVPMAGSVVLGDWVEDAGRGLMAPGSEFLTYRTLDEAEETARYYLQNEDELGEVRKRGGERAAREHTYAHRAKSVLQAMGF
ncbi:MAG: glycosyltransferase family 1 protein [Candidatus Omnitrophica bacterium]|nr:glycosyltransferase family 1 protein [Candidatus Omnitrophota bacterium]